MPEPSRSDSKAPIPAAPPLLLCEALGFSPQLLLDDIINIANNSIQDGINGMEQFLEKWTNDRLANGKSASDADAVLYEVEQGLVAFQTLLEYHTDVAFDFFEAWSLRNIFFIPADLPVVLPHQEGQNLNVSLDREQELMEEIEELRKRLDGQRKLKRVLNAAIRAATKQQARSEKRLESVAHIAPPSSTALDTINALPDKFLDMFNEVATLPPLDLPPPPEQAQVASGKRQWEASKNGYLNWALGRMLVRTEGVQSGTSNPAQGYSAVTHLADHTARVGNAADLRQAMEALDAVTGALHDVGGDYESEGADDSRMDES